MRLVLPHVLGPTACLLALSIALSDPVFAAPDASAATGTAGAASPEASEARRRFREASSAAESGQWQAALKLYRSAYALYPHATTLYNIGYCHGQLGESTRALYYTSQALDPGAFPAGRTLADEREAAARNFQQLLLERLGSVTLTVESKRPFLLKVDGAPPVPSGTGDGSFIPQPDASVAHEDRVFLERVTLRLDPGSHEVVIVAEDGSYGRTLEVVPGQTITIPWSLGSEPEPAKAAPVVLAPPPAPAAPPPPAAKAERERSIAPAPEHESSVYRPLALSSFVVGGAGLGLGLVSGIVVLTTGHQLDDVCEGGACPEEESRAVDRYRIAAQLTNVGLWTGVVGGALGAGFLLLDRTDDQPGLSVSVGASRVELQGSF